MAIPPLMVYTLDTYGLEGTLLIMGGITLNLCVCGMLFRPAKFYMRRYCLKLERQRRIRAAVLDGVKEPRGSVYVKHETGDTEDATNGGYVNPIAVGDTCLDKDTASDQRCPYKADSPHKESLQHKEIDSEASDEVNGTNEELNDVAIVQLCVGECRSYTDAQTNDKDDTTTEQLRSSAVRTDCPIKTDNMGVSAIDTDVPSTTDINGTSSNNQPSKHPLIEWRLLTHPVLVIYALSMGMASSTYFNFFIMATPHAEQLGFSLAKAALLISMMGAADMFSRVATGVFADLNFVRKRHIFHASLAMSSVVFLVLPSLKTYPTLAIACVLFSVAGGGYISIFPPLLADELGIERLHTTFGMASLIIGCTDFVVPAVMGRYTSIRQKTALLASSPAPLARFVRHTHILQMLKKRNPFFGRIPLICNVFKKILKFLADCVRPNHPLKTPRTGQYDLARFPYKSKAHMASGQGSHWLIESPTVFLSMCNLP